ncbi:MAG: HAD family hydrolase [Chloroflexota bacterium]
MKSPNGITTILFDLDDTLRHNEPHGHGFFLDYAATLGAPDLANNRHNARQWAFQYWADSEHLFEDINTHGRGEPAFWHNYSVRHLVAMGCTTEQAQELAPQVHQHMSDNYEPEDVVLPETKETLKELHAAGYTLAVVTNRSEPVHEYIHEIELGHYFDFTLAGGEIKSWKPKPEIFHAALERAGVTAEQAVYVGDNYYADILGARAVGIFPILLDPHTHFPDADCQVIRLLSDLVAVLDNGIDSNV